MHSKLEQDDMSNLEHLYIHNRSLTYLQAKPFSDLKTNKSISKCILWATGAGDRALELKPDLSFSEIN